MTEIVTTVSEEGRKLYELLPVGLLPQISDRIVTEERPVGKYVLNLRICGGEEIRELNRRFRGLDHRTDTLSFPMDSMVQDLNRDCGHAKASSAGKQDCIIIPEIDPVENSALNQAECVSEENEILLGDIVIDINMVFEQKGSKSFIDEFTEVFIHSVLHIMGYDHTRVKDRELMDRKQHYFKNMCDMVLLSGTGN